ncbi:asparagine synthetase domain-containing protein 1-like [Macrobrachium nipponense]|uniref:asparagine synthetase domain-containing protein 1-like n=1 Tax=Macrobrachium nipponense TaxID=159736 RepID=UPI0030C861E2
MCGICFICCFSEDEIDGLVSSNQTLLSRRGPDCIDKRDIKIDELRLTFQGSVLWLQGDEPSPQPFEDSHGNLLLWNGDILAGYEISKEISDTKYISEALASKDEDEMILFFSKIKGPWSFVYFRKEEKRLYFGRDMFGRHSLLWQKPQEDCPVFMVSSVSHRKESVQEVPALGIYFLDLDSKRVLSDFCVSLIPWSHKVLKGLGDLESFIRVEQRTIVSPVVNPLNTTVADDTTTDFLRSLPCSLGKADTEHLYSSMKIEIDNLLNVLCYSVQRRVDKCPQRCKNCTRSMECNHSKIAVLFSGGVDSAMIALILDTCVDVGESIDLLNVAFAQKHSANGNEKNTKANTKIKDSKLETRHDTPLDYDVPDRITGRECWRQLQGIRPNRKWNFVEINVTSEELAEERASHISHLVAPLMSVLDDSIGCALWFGGRGQGFIAGNPYTSPARVLLCGMGADEQLGGYARHRVRFNDGGWAALLEEIDLEISRIPTRNLGRDNRILADHGRAPRFPYLDEDVVSFLNTLPIWMKANLDMPRGLGEKLILRVAASRLGLTIAAGLPKRAIQFGSRIAKLENSKEKGSDSCTRLLSNS